MSTKTNKLKLNELAKDLNVSNNEVIECLEKFGGEQKKTQSALTPEEVSYVFEYFTQKNQVENFNAYFANNKKPEKSEKTEKTEKKETVKKTENKSEKKPAAKAKPKTDEAKQEKNTPS